jgi:thiamine kinase-like enzyme
MSLEEAAAKAAGLACWKGPVDPQPVSGGNTNTNFRISDGGESFLVRIGGNIPVHGIRRTYETACSHAAHAAGIAPEVVFAAKGALVIRWIDGKTFDEAAVRNPTNRDRIVALLQRLHAEGARHLRGRAPLFWVFHVNRDYGHRMHDDDHRLKDKVPRLMELNETLERAVGPVELALCHNDLLAANFIDDGDRLWLLDWEYAGYDSTLFDLANLASNSQFDVAAQSDLLTSYFGAPPTADLLHRMGAMMCASLLREAMWSMIQEVHSGLDFDFVAYTAENLERFENALTAWRASA